MAKDQISNQRVSVFDRLGPKTQNTSEPHSVAPKDDQFEIPARRVNNTYPDRRRRGGGANGNKNPPEGPRNAYRETPAAAASSTPKVHIKPNALLHRTLQDVKKERIKEAFVANPSAAIEDLEQRLQQAESDRIAAEELSNALLLTQQTLLQDKTKLQAENVHLKREMEALKERLDYLDIDGGCSPAPRLRNHAHGDDIVAGDYAEYDDGDLINHYAEGHRHYQAITPDSGLLKALQMKAFAAPNSGSGGGGLQDEGEDARSYLEDLRDIAKKLEEDIELKKTID
jgi:pentose-5-phosphate-3-epimerase